MKMKVQRRSYKIFILGFHEIRDQTALAMWNQIKKSIYNKNLDKCCGQGYDGANNINVTSGGLKKLKRYRVKCGVYSLYCS